ncbi:MAG TPA: M1 family aminopeptidase, partial [Pyrinomonadaceae bacterium]|nr:M1 family aminopeptidase [Pyrinomonadaceae bacterium]
MSASALFAQTPPIEPGVSHELATWRAARYSDVRYKLNLTLEKMSPVLKGTIEIRVKTYGDPVDPTKGRGIQYFHIAPIILDWRKIKGYENLSTISNVSVNGKKVEKGTLNERALRELQGGDTRAAEYFEHQEHLIFSYGTTEAENVIKLDFTSPILTSGSAITRYVDKEDGAEYLYSLFVPSDASTAFPVFDQPDLKARFQLDVEFPNDWTVIANSPERKPVCESPCFDRRIIDLLPGKRTWKGFEETKPISTYVFAFAVGPFEEFEDHTVQTITTRKALPGESLLALKGSKDDTVVELDKDVILPRVFVRKSHAAKFQPHAAEVFRLNREGIKFLEQYFDYKFPFPKYDIVLIPEFPFGGMEHAGCTFLKESSVIFPQEPTKNDYISRANLIFHETAHQWFGDTVTMKWFDDLWLKEGFAEFMAYKTLEKVMPDANAWKVFYERNKQAAYLTDSTKGTTPIYQKIDNLSAAKSAYGNIVYRKAPSFLRQAEFYIGPDKFQTAVRAFLKKHEFANAGWEDLVKEFETASGRDLKEWADFWVKRPGVVKIRISQTDPKTPSRQIPGYITLSPDWTTEFHAEGFPPNAKLPLMKGMMYALGSYRAETLEMGWQLPESLPNGFKLAMYEHYFTFPNYHDYAYGIFLLDDKSRDYVLKNIQNEKDAFLRSMMWGSLWDSVREGELDPREYVELVIKNLSDITPSAEAASTPPKKGGEKKPPLLSR